MDNDPKQTTDAGNNPTGDPNASIENLLADINNNNNMISQVFDRLKVFEEIADLNWDDELEKLKEKHPNLERWQIFLLKKLPDSAAEFFPRYLEWTKQVKNEVKRQERILDIVLEFQDGKAWADLLGEYPEFADKCDWSKLTDEDWSKLLEKQPQFADKRGK
jgi:hypothetical protein